MPYRYNQSHLVTLVRYKRYIIAALPDNFDEDLITALEDQLLKALAQDRTIKGVLIGMDAVSSTDPIELEKLRNMLMAVRLLGVKSGIFGINPGLAAVMTKINLSLPIEAAGYDMEDLLQKIDP